MIRPPSFMCFSAALVAKNTPRMLTSITRSSSSRGGFLERPRYGRAGVVHEHVQPAEGRDPSPRRRRSRRRQSAASAWIAIALPPAFSISSTTDLARLRAFRVGDRHARPVGREPPGDRRPDAARAAGHESDLVGQICHGKSPRRKVEASISPGTGACYAPPCRQGARVYVRRGARRRPAAPGDGWGQRFAAGGRGTRWRLLLREELRGPVGERDRLVAAAGRLLDPEHDLVALGLLPGDFGRGGMSTSLRERLSSLEPIAFLSASR